MSDSTGAYKRASKIASLLAGIAGLGEYQRLTDRTARVVWDPAAERAGGAADLALVLGGKPEKPSVVLSDLAGWYPLQQAIEAVTAFPEAARTVDVLEALLDPAIDRIAVQAEAALQAQSAAYLAQLPPAALPASAQTAAPASVQTSTSTWSPGFIAYLVGLGIFTVVAVKLGGVLGMLAVWAIAEGIRRLVAGRGVALPITMVVGGTVYWMVVGFVLLIAGVEQPQTATPQPMAGVRTPYHGPVIPPGTSPAPAPATTAAPTQEQHAWNALLLRWEADNATFLQDPARMQAMQAAIDANEAKTGGRLSHEELLQFAEADAFRATRWDPRTQTVRPRTPDTMAVEAYLQSVPELKRD